MCVAQNRRGRRGGAEGAAADGPPALASDNSPPQPVITNVYNYNLFSSSHPTPSQITAPPNLHLSIAAPDGPTLQLTASSSSDHSVPSSSPNVRGQSLAVAAAPNQSGQPAMAVGPDRKKLSQRTLSSPAGPLSASAMFPETRGARQAAPAFSGTACNRSSDTIVTSTNHCALAGIGSGDFVARDPIPRSLPSGGLRSRHLRKHSL